MYIHDMNTIQLQLEATFVNITSAFGWDGSTISSLLHSGVNVHPEGAAFFSDDQYKYELFLRVEEGSLTLNSEEKLVKTSWGMKVFYRNSFREVLTWICEHLPIQLMSGEEIKTHLHAFNPAIRILVESSEDEWIAITE